MRLPVIMVIAAFASAGCLDESSHWYSICNRAPGTIDVESTLVKVKQLVDEDLWTEWREDLTLEANVSREPVLLELRGGSYELRVTVTPRDDLEPRNAVSQITNGRNGGLRLLVGAGLAEQPPGFEFDRYQIFLAVEESPTHPETACA